MFTSLLLTYLLSNGLFLLVVQCQQFVNLPNGLPSVQRPNNNNINNHVVSPSQLPGNNNQFPGPQFPILPPQTNVHQPQQQPQSGGNIGNPAVTPTHAVVAGSSIAFMLRRGIRSTQTNQNGAYISYQHEVTKINSNINAASGIFLVQIPGVYAFSISGIGATNSAFRITLRKNGDVIALIFGLQSQMASDSAVVAANVGDYIYPSVEGAITDSSFSGYVIAMTESIHPSRASSTASPFSGGIFGNSFDPYPHSNNGAPGNNNNNNNVNPFMNDFFSGNQPMYSGFPNNGGLSRTSNNNTRVVSPNTNREADDQKTNEQVNTTELDSSETTTKENLDRRNDISENL